MGGIASGGDAAEFMAAGAAVIAVGTESFRDPAAGRRIGDELAGLADHGSGKHRTEGRAPAPDRGQGSGAHADPPS